MSRGDSAGSALAWLSHPFSLGGLGLLLLNDHVFKQVWPGPVTGKLSDFAGMVMFPALLAVLVSLAVPRVPVKVLAPASLCVTAIGFSWAKLDSAAAAAVSDVLSAFAGPSVLRADATDLLALPALALSWLAFRRAQRRPVAAATARGVRAAVLIPVALLGTLATSKATAVPPPEVAKGIDGRVWYGDGNMRYVSADGGETFSHERVEGDPPVRMQDCAGEVCYRVVIGELRVESSVDGGRTWRVSWEATEGQRRDMIRAESGGDEELLDRWESSSVVVMAASGTAAGHRVLLANGRAGLWLRDGQGTWSRMRLSGGSDGVYLPVPARSVLSQGLLPGGETFFVVTVALLVQLLGGLGVIALRVLAPWRLSGWAVGFAAASICAVAADVAVLMLGDRAHAILVVAAAALAAGCLGLAGWLIAGYRHNIPSGYLAAMLGVAVVSAVCMEYLRQDLGWASFPAPVLLTPILVAGLVICTLIGFAARAQVGRRP